MSEAIVSYLLGFLSGAVLGVFTFVVCSFFILRKLYLKNKDINVEVTTEGPKDPALNKSVVERLKKATEITKRQNEISSSTSMPSANALHSKYKNSLVRQYKDLEEEKMVILQSIVKDGFDPEVTIYNAMTQKHETMKLSDFLTNFAPNPVTKPSQAPVPKTGAPTTKTESIDDKGIRKVEKNGRTFFVITGGETNENDPKKPTSH